MFLIIIVLNIALHMKLTIDGRQSLEFRYRLSVANIKRYVFSVL